MTENNLSKTYFDLIDLVEEQSKIIKQQSEMIARFVNDEAERENMINELLKWNLTP